MITVQLELTRQEPGITRSARLRGMRRQVGMPTVSHP
jgi:hypothetical protein